MDKESIILTVGSQDRTGFIVSVETVTRRGIFQFDIIGLANKTISESKQRILSAISFSLHEKKHYVNKKITTLLSPADARKEGSHFDLPIAISYLISVKKLLKGARSGAESVSNPNPSSSSNSSRTSGISRMENRAFSFSKIIILGELTLTGSVLPIKQIALLIRAGIDQGILHFLIPEGNMAEMRNFEGIYMWPVRHISEVINMLDKRPDSILDKFKQIRKAGIETLSAQRQIETGTAADRLQKEEESKKISETGKTFLLDSISGNTTAKRALEIALAGKHHILFIGTPGSGKSLLAKAARELIPELDPSRSNIFQTRRRDLESGSGASGECQINFREPHHTSNYSEMIGNRFTPGEIVLAHGGILFLDELAEFNRRVLEGLRQPMETKYIQKNHSTQEAPDAIIPTDFILIGCMNPCDCGYSRSNQSHGRSCICARSQIEKYRVLDEDISEIKPPIQGARPPNQRSKQTGETGTSKQGQSGYSIRENIKRVRKIQEDREIGSGLDIGGEAKRLFDEICIRFNFSKREEASLLRVARTIADLAASELITKDHVLEASSYKNNMRML
jgi:magnesium chelatase family protein